MTMRPLINLAIIFVLPFAISSSSNEATNANEPAPTVAIDNGKYCNARFDFCVKFPDLLLSEKIISDNDDGIHLASNDGKVCAEISGIYNVGNWSLTDIYDFTFEDITNDYPDDVKYVSYHIGKTSYDAIFEYGGELHYYKTMLHKNNSIVALMIAVPKGMESLLSNLKDEIEIDLHEKTISLN
jgi:hypothetical protein